MPDRSGTGIEHPRRAGCSSSTAPRCGAAASSSSSPTATRRSPRANVSRTVQFAVPTPATPSSGATPPPEIVACTAAQFVADGGVKYAFTGARPDLYRRRRRLRRPGTYGVSPPGTYLFAPGDENQVVTIAYTYANATAYAPDLTPIYDLTDLDFVDEKGNKDPVQASRVDPFTLPTIQRVECLSRANQYGVNAGRGARPVADRTLRPARRLDDPGPRNLRRDQHRADRRADDPATPALRARAFHLQAVVGILPARSDGHRDDQRRQPRPRPTIRCASSPSKRTTRGC